MKKLIYFVTFFLFSCAAYEKFDIPDPYEEQRKYDEERRKYEEINQFLKGLSYDETLILFGEPTSTTQGDEIFVATWKNEKESVATWPLKIGKRQVYHHITLSHGEKFELIFDKESRKVMGWRYKNW